MNSHRIIGTLRWFAAVVAFAFMVGAGFLTYLHLFILERFGLMALIVAIALWLAATVLWWFVAEANAPLTRTRIRHILIGAIALGIVGLLVGARGDRRFADGLLMAGMFEAPLAFILGGTLGAFYSLLRLRGTQRT
jgi:hypothetical protein